MYSLKHTASIFPLSGAEFVLEQKEIYQEQAEELEEKMLEIEQQKLALEGANITATVEKTMQTGAVALKIMGNKAPAAAIEVVGEMETTQTLVTTR